MTCLIDESYSNHVVKDGDHKNLYLVLSKALCSTTKAELLWWNLLNDTLAENDFKLNPCDLCAANAFLKKNQWTITWHADETKMSNTDSDTVDDVIHIMESKFGKMKLGRGRYHEFLGQVITHNKNGTFDLDTSSYLKEAIENFGEPMDPAVTPARSELFALDHTSPLVDEKRKKTIPPSCA